MTEPNWIKVEVLIATQKEVVAEHGGIDGVRDMHLLESSCSAPLQLYHYSNPKPSICELSAKYAYSLSRNHPFRDGNKRTAALACELFLELNDYTLMATDEEMYFIFIDLAAGKLKEAELIQWIQAHAVTHLYSSS